MWVYKYIIIYYTIIDTPVLKIYKYALIICTSFVSSKMCCMMHLYFTSKKQYFFDIVHVKVKQRLWKFVTSYCTFFCPYNSFFPYPLMEKQS